MHFIILFMTLITLATALPQPRPQPQLRSQPDSPTGGLINVQQFIYDPQEDTYQIWLDEHTKRLGLNKADKSKRSQLQFKPYEDTYSALLAARKKRLDMGAVMKRDVWEGDQSERWKKVRRESDQEAEDAGSLDPIWAKWLAEKGSGQSLAGGGGK